jgi:calcium/calmodulin-dependent protein kinase I
MSLDAQYEVERHSFAKGCQVEVCRCTHRDSGIQRAVKIYNTGTLGPRRSAMAVEEGQLAKSLPQALQLVRIFDVYQEDGRVAIVMELMERGSLFQQLSTHGSIPEARARVLARHLFTGLSLLHSIGVMHRDIKPENIFLRGTQGAPEDVVTIGDFGFATRRIPSEDCVGSPQYSAPELALIGLQQNSRAVAPGGRPLYNEKCDIWSAGVVVFVMLSGLLPFDGATPTDVFTAVIHNAVPYDKVGPGKITAQAKAFIQLMMTSNPSKRPSAKEALCHPWLTG